MDPLYYLKKICRAVLLGLVAIVFLKCLFVPNAIDVLILVGLLVLVMGSLTGGCRD